MFDKIVINENEILAKLDKEFNDFLIKKSDWRKKVVISIEWRGGGKYSEQVEHSMRFEDNTIADALNKFNNWYEEKYKKN